MNLPNTTVNQVEPPPSNYSLFWDSTLTGFALRVTNKGVKSYIVESRFDGKTPRVTLGHYGVITADQAKNLP